MSWADSSPSSLCPTRNASTAKRMQLLRWHSSYCRTKNPWISVVQAGDQKWVVPRFKNNATAESITADAHQPFTLLLPGKNISRAFGSILHIYHGKGCFRHAVRIWLGGLLGVDIRSMKRLQSAARGLRSKRNKTFKSPFFTVKYSYMWKYVGLALARNEMQVS